MRFLKKHKKSLITVVVELVLVGGGEGWRGLRAVQDPDVDAGHPPRTEMADGVLSGLDIQERTEIFPNENFSH